jgi:hypothetical protein
MPRSDLPQARIAQTTPSDFALLRFDSYGIHLDSHERVPDEWSGGKII